MSIRCFLGLHNWWAYTITCSVWPVEWGKFIRECRRCGKRRRS